MRADDPVAEVLERLQWTKSGSQVLPGLVKRREREAAMYRKGGRAG